MQKFIKCGIQTAWSRGTLELIKTNIDFATQLRIFNQYPSLNAINIKGLITCIAKTIHSSCKSFLLNLHIKLRIEQLHTQTLSKIINISEVILYKKI